MRSWLSDIALLWCGLWLWVAAVHGGGERKGFLLGVGVVLGAELLGRRGRQGWIRWAVVSALWFAVWWFEPRWPLGSAFPLAVVGAASLGTLVWVVRCGLPMGEFLVAALVVTGVGTLLRAGAGDEALVLHGTVMWCGLGGLMGLARVRGRAIGKLSPQAHAAVHATAYGGMALLGAEAAGIWRWDSALAPRGPGVPWVGYLVVPALLGGHALLRRIPARGVPWSLLRGFLVGCAVAMLLGGVGWLADPDGGRGARGLLRRAAIRWGFESPDVNWRPGAK